MQEKKHFDYNIKITEKQADVIIRALDVYSRVGIGQFKNIFEDIFTIDVTSREDVSNLISALRDSIGCPPVNLNRGMTHLDTPENVRIAYEISKALECFRSWKRNPKGGHTVNFHQPLKLSDEPFIRIADATRTTTGGKK